MSRTRGAEDEEQYGGVDAPLTPTHKAGLMLNYKSQLLDSNVYKCRNQFLTGHYIVQFTHWGGAEGGGL